MIVMKFGGTSVQNEEAIKRAIESFSDVQGYAFALQNSGRG